MPNPIKDSDAAKQLADHYHQMKSIAVRDLFSQDPVRFEKYSIEYQDLFFDYSKNFCSDETLSLLFELAQACGFDESRRRLFATEQHDLENPMSLHTALRASSDTPLVVKGENITEQIVAARKQMRSVCTSLADRPGKISNIVSLGIGGSHLGVAMGCRALHPFKQSSATVHFVSTAGSDELEKLLATLDPEQTCFIIISKNFSTRETLMNAQYAKNWLGVDNSNCLFAVTAQVNRAIAFGIKASHCLALPDAISGRYSLFSLSGLPLAIYLGMDAFEEFLSGARAMDEHFQNAELPRNIPAIMALLGIWYNNFYGAQSHAILCYDPNLELFPAYLQQLEMESNGKRVGRDGQLLDYDTAPIIWGGNALNGQHAYYQLLHQGTRLVPADFIVSANPAAPVSHNAAWPHANCFAQAQVLMSGRQNENAERALPGNRPTNTILLRQLTPHTLGMLVALYEHKTYTEGLIWKVQSFDQWSVEYGKQLSDRIFSYLSDEQSDTLPAELDQSTQGLINQYLSWRS